MLARVARALGDAMHRWPRVTVALTALLSSALAALPFGYPFRLLSRFLDGPFYIVVAKTFYAISASDATAVTGLDRTYYASHLPLYPALVRLLAPLAGYAPGLLLATLLTFVASALLFHELLARTRWVRSPLWTTALYCVLPPRWVVYHTAGATEPLLFCCLFASLLAWEQRRAPLVALCVCLASLTRVTGILLLPAYALLFALERDWRALRWIAASGLGLVLLCAWHHVQLGDALALLRYNQGKLGIVRWPPGSLLLASAATPAYQTSEYYLLTYLLYGMGTLYLWDRRPLFVISAIYYTFTVLLFHADIGRFFLTIAPFALLVAFDRVLCERPARLAVLLALPFVYAYAWGYFQQNLLSDYYYEKIMIFVEP